MSTQEVKDALNCIYIKAQAAGLCRDKKSFALFIKAPHTNVIQALNGDEKYLTQGMLNKAKVAMSDYEHGLSIGGDNTQSPINLGGQQKNFGLQAQDLAQVVNTLCHEMAEQRMSYERLLMAAINGQKLAEK